jgi:4-aminobutyrate aminotransferase/(S)-3-amino-2-methylpropionate transaminase
MLTAAPGPASIEWSRRFAAVSAPMGPRAAADPEPVGPDAAPASAAAAVVYREACGANVVDMDGNRYVDLAAGFGSLLLGHRPERILEALGHQARRLLQSLGDVHPSEVKIRLLERLVERVFDGAGQAILGQSGADAISAALKTAMLHTGKPGVIAFGGAYHGLSYGPLSLCGLRGSYRAPFAAQLNPSVRFVEYPASGASLDSALGAVRKELLAGDVGAIVFEPILGRGGCLVPPDGFARELGALCREHSCLFIADEIWTGLGRSGHWLFSRAQGADPDLVCLGKGLGGGLPISACVGKREVMAAWSREDEVVHTSTFAGAPLACAAALDLLDAIEQGGLIERSLRIGQELAAALAAVRHEGASAGFGEVQGSGLMLAIQVGAAPGSALTLARRLLQAGYIVSLGGGRRESIVLTPALDIPEALLDGFVRSFAEAARSVSA